MLQITDIEFFDDIEDLLIWRKQKANNYAFQANYSAPTLEEMNNRMAQLDGHILRVNSFLEQKNFEKAKTEFEELKKSRLNIYHTMRESFDGTSFDALIGACFLKSIKGQKAKIESDSDIKEYAERLKKVPANQLAHKIEQIKKKLRLS